jgi:hypothetical protein
VPRLPDPEPVDAALLDVLHSRDGRETLVEPDGGRKCRVLNIAWGYDSGDHCAHITINCSPLVAGVALDFFFTNEIARVEDAISGDVVWLPGA